jgi:flagellar motor switch protein FliM
MATAQPRPEPSPAGQTRATRLQGPAETAAAQPLIASGPACEPKALLALTAPLARLPAELEVSIPVRLFRVRNLLAMEPGAVIETQWSSGEDMPLSAGAVQLAWSEFEVLDTQLAVRVTRLA